MLCQCGSSKKRFHLIPSPCTSCRQCDKQSGRELGLMDGSQETFACSGCIRVMLVGGTTHSRNNARTFLRIQSRSTEFRQRSPGRSGCFFPRVLTGLVLFRVQHLQNLLIGFVIVGRNCLEDICPFRSAACVFVGDEPSSWRAPGPWRG